MRLTNFDEAGVHRIRTIYLLWLCRITTKVCHRFRGKMTRTRDQVEADAHRTVTQLFDNHVVSTVNHCLQKHQEDVVQTKLQKPFSGSAMRILAYPVSFLEGAKKRKERSPETAIMVRTTSWVQYRHSRRHSADDLQSVSTSSRCQKSYARADGSCCRCHEVGPVVIITVY